MQSWVRRKTSSVPLLEIWPETKDATISKSHNMISYLGNETTVRYLWQYLKELYAMFSLLCVELAVS